MITGTDIRAAIVVAMTELHGNRKILTALRSVLEDEVATDLLAAEVLRQLEHRCLPHTALAGDLIEFSRTTSGAVRGAVRLTELYMVFHRKPSKKAKRIPVPRKKGRTGRRQAR